MKVAQAMAILGVSRRTIYNWLTNGRLQSTGTGRERRIDLESIAVAQAAAAKERSKPTAGER